MISATSRKSNLPQVGTLIYLIITRPDLSYLVGLFSQFMQTPHDIHLDCDKRVLPYVSDTMNYVFCYKSTMLIRLEGYTMPSRPGDTQCKGLSSRLEMEPSHGVTRRIQPSHYRAQRKNIATRLWLHVKSYGLRGS